MSTLSAIAVAVVSTILAALRLVAFAATGSMVLRRDRPAAIHIPLTILAGAAVTAAVYALLVGAGWLGLAYGADALLTTVSLAVGGRRAIGAFASLGSSARSALGTSPLRRAVAWLVVVLYWLPAAVPPRDTDSLRYHLAHVRQIDAEGVWTSIPIVHYALPFAWQIGFLPFLHWHLPEVAQLLAVGMAMIVAAAVLSELRPPETAMGTLPLLVLAALMLQPLVLTIGTIASPDQFTIVAVLATCLLLRRIESGSLPELRALGFASWVAVGSRYQAVAIGLAALVAVSTLVLRRQVSVRGLLPYAQGALAAVLLALPWYAVNHLAFANAVWPLHVSPASALYTDRVASAFASAWHGPETASFRLQAIWLLLSAPLAFPLPLVVIGAALWLLRRPAPSPAALGTLALSYLVVWALAQPLLFPRFIVYMAPVAMLGLTWWASEGTALSRPARRLLRLASGAGLVVFAVYDGASAFAPASYLATGDWTTLLRHTWYTPVYDWISTNTKPDARVLVIVGSGESYYLDRPHRRADPATSAVVDWSSIADPMAFAAWLRRERFDYVVYEDIDWSDAPAGARMREIMTQARSSGVLSTLETFHLELSRSRFRRGFVPTTIYVLRVPPATGAPPTASVSPSSCAAPCCTPAGRSVASSPGRSAAAV